MGGGLGGLTELLRVKMVLIVLGVDGLNLVFPQSSNAEIPLAQPTLAGLENLSAKGRETKKHHN